jgi:hypothetical protein
MFHHASYLDGPRNLNFLLLHGYTEHLTQTLIATNSRVNQIKKLYDKMLKNTLQMSILYIAKCIFFPFHLDKFKVFNLMFYII